MVRARSPSEIRLEIGRQRVVAAFATHWSAILKNSTGIAKERAGCFFAGSASVRERLAHSFYGREHARQMASLNPTEICEALSPWLEHALQYWLEEYEDNEDPAGVDFLAGLPTAEYVSIVYLHYSFAGRFLIGPYPSDFAGYDDLYERLLAGFSIGGVLRIYKSTGERFTPSEARSARAGIRRDLLEGMADAGDDDPWVLDMEAEGNCEAPGFEDEDLELVVIAEVNKYGEDED